MAFLSHIESLSFLAELYHIGLDLSLTNLSTVFTSCSGTWLRVGQWPTGCESCKDDAYGGFGLVCSQIKKVGKEVTRPALVFCL